MKNKIDWQNIRGDGGSRPCTEEKLTSLKEEFRQLCVDAGASANDRHELAGDVRFCLWGGQSRDGRKHADALGRAAFPFEGASDARLRLADATVNEQVQVLMAALLRAQVTFRSVEEGDDELAGVFHTLWEYVLGGQLSAEWFIEWAKAVQWRQGDSPAVAFMQVYWKQEYELSLVETDTDDVRARALALLEQQGVTAETDPEAVADIEALLFAEERQGDLAGLVLALWPGVAEARSLRVAKELQEDGRARFPVPHVREDRLAVKARRLFHDIFVPENTPTDVQRARAIFVREWKSEVDLREEEARGLYKPGFVDAVLAHEGVSGWEHWSCYGDGVLSGQPGLRADDPSRRRGQFEIMTAFVRAVNADGIPGIYTVDYHHAVGFAGTDMELLDYRMGQYPFVPLMREILSDSLWDSRGIPELSATDQNSLKLLHDSFMDHAQLSTIPPMEVPASRPNLDLTIGPLKKIKVNRPGEIRFMTMMQYPQTNPQVRDSIMRMHQRYFGNITAPEVNPPDYVRLYQEFLVGSFMVEVSAVMRMGMKLIQQFFSDEMLARVLGEPGVELGRTADEIQGGFDVTLAFEPGMLNLEYLQKVGQMLSEYVLNWDSLSVVERDKLVRWFLSSLSPSLASRITRDVESAEQDEIDEEESNFTKIAAGIEPVMREDGQNFALRLQVLEGIVERNPEAFSGMAPNSQRIFEARVQHLRGQVEQMQNAIIGRTMAKPALEEND